MVKKAVIPQSVKTSVNGITKIDFVLPSAKPPEFTEYIILSLTK